MNVKLSAIALLVLCSGLPCGAQQDRTPAAVPPPPDVAASAAAPLAGEPAVQHTVIEDKGSRIDELRVRGTTQRITVTPKVGPGKSYQIIMGDGSRNLTDTVGGERGAAGKRVWNVLDF